MLKSHCVSFDLLNRSFAQLDVGVDEKIMLMSRDEQSCLIVSYKEIKNCIISAFNDLRSGRK
jgi:Pan3 Pseudokinase domain